MEYQYTGAGNLEVMQEAVNYNRYLASLVLKQKIEKSDALLDIGAGIGVFAEMIQQAGYVVKCLEPDMSQAKILMEKGYDVYASINEVAGNTFDFLYAYNVLEHIDDDKGALLQWVQKLKPGGRMLIYVPAFNSLYSSMDKLVGHFRRYKRKDLTTLCRAVGLTPIYKPRYVDSIGFFASLIFKYVCKNNGNLNKKSLILYDRILFPLSRIGDLFFYKLFGKNIFIVAQK